MQTKGIKSVSIKSLHSYIDVDLKFNQGLNVIYGKNGKGKTTVLHVLSNIMELDFERFVHLQFTTIEVHTFENQAIKITKSDKQGIHVFLNNSKIGIRQQGKFAPILQEHEVKKISEIFGGRPVYLPAYRSILEKVKGGPDSAKNHEYEEIKRNELAPFSSANSYRYPWEQDERATSVARKTLQCRDWFGDFIPIIRYPTLTEVAEILSAEFIAAQGEANSSERTMLSSVFIGVFKSLVSNHDTPSDWEIDPLIEQVKRSLEADQDDTLRKHDDIGHRLSEELARAKISSTAGENAALKRVLKLYAETLQIRNNEKMNAFKSIRNFEAAVNLFLDGKQLKVSDQSPQGVLNRWRAFAYILTANKTFPLTTLSSGERQILTMLFSATRMSTSATGVFLIDEPELSLHVDWQRIILSALKIQAPLRQIIACTHSPEVGADHDDAVQLFSPKLTEKPFPQSDVTDEL